MFNILFIYHYQVEFMIMHDEKTFCMNVFLRSNTSLRLREFAKIFYTKRKKREKGFKFIRHIKSEFEKEELIAILKEKEKRKMKEKMRIMCIYLFLHYMQ